jgi:hypothetical protein
MLLSKYVSTLGRDINLLFYRFYLFLLFLIVGFRDKIGCDWANYAKLFDYERSVNLGSMAIQGEIGFVALTNTLKYFNLSFTHLNVAISFIFFFGFHILAKRQKDPLTFLILAFPILIILLPMSGVRQGAAVGILCIALTCFMDKKLLKYIALVILAGTFHKSAILFLGLAPFIKSNFSFKSVFIAIIALTPLLFLESLNSILSVYTVRYLSSGLESSGAVFRLAMLVLTSLYFFVFLRKRWERDFPEDYKLILIGSLAMLICFPLLALSTTAADRLGFYLIPFQLIILARIQFFSGKYRQLATLFPFILIISTFLIWASFSDFFNACYSPYAMKGF